MIVKVRVLPGALLTDNRSTFGPDCELEMEQAEANRRIEQGKVEMVGVDPPSLNDVVFKLPAADVIAAARVAITMDALAELRGNEDRKTVLAAIEAREQELSK